jgi:hypothetical protein
MAHHIVPSSSLHNGFTVAGGAAFGRVSTDEMRPHGSRRATAPHHEEDPIYRHSQMAADFAVAKIRWHRAFVQCIVLNTSISYLDVIMDMDQIGRSWR